MGFTPDEWQRLMQMQEYCAPFACAWITAQGNATLNYLCFYRGLMVTGRLARGTE